MPDISKVTPKNRIAEIMIDGKFVSMDFDDLRNGDIFRLLEPDGITLEGDGKTWIAVSEIYDGDVKMVPSILAEPAGREE